MNKDTWIAYHAPAGEQDISKGGFLSEEEAWGYVETHICKECKSDLEKGRTDYGYGDGDYIEVDHVSGTGCGCEWFVLKEKDFAKCKDFGDILDAAGWKKVNEIKFNPKEKK